MVCLTACERILAIRVDRCLAWSLLAGMVFASVPPQTPASAGNRFGSPLLNWRYGYTPKYYGHEPTGYVWPIHGARYPYAARYYLNLPPGVPIHPPDRHLFDDDPLAPAHGWPCGPPPLIGPAARPPGYPRHGMPLFSPACTDLEPTPAQFLAE